MFSSNLLHILRDSNFFILFIWSLYFLLYLSNYMPYRWEAENDVQVLPNPGDEKVHDVLGRGRPPGMLPFHDRYQLHDDLTLLVPVEKVRHHPRGEHVVQILQEPFVLDVLVREYERRALPLDPARPVQHFEVFQEVVGIVRPNQWKKKPKRKLSNVILLFFQKGRILSKNSQIFTLSKLFGTSCSQQ